MRNTLFFLLTFLSTNFLIFSQNEPTIDYAGELSKSVEVPQSPEAAAFEKYGNVGVSMYTGTPDISVPIYTIDGREMDLPISLSYDASGVKVTQLSSQVGLSWSLAVGGRISRVVNGMPDDYIQGDYASIHRGVGIYSAQEIRDNIDTYSLITTDFATLQEGEDYVQFLYDINVNKVDSEPDYFSINVPGLSDHILIDISSTGNLQAKALKNPNIKVEYTLISPGYINRWDITIENGTKYIFNLFETTHVTSTDGLNQVNNGVTKEYTSSWVLTRIESPNKKDNYDFTYNNNNIAFNYWTQPFPIGASSVTNQLDPNSGVTEFPGYNSHVTYSPTYKIRQLYLTQIYHNTKLVVDLDLGPRLDIDRATNNYNSALESITVHDSSGGILKQYDLHHSYFGATSYNDALTKDAFDVRLKLDSVQIKGNGGTNRYSSYQFEYFSPDNLPSTQSTSQDYMGYYNGKNNGTILYPEVTEGGLHFHGANRGVDLNYAKKGNLQKIVYPTGGSTEFFYESHSYVANSGTTTQTVKVIKGSCTENSTQGNPDGAAICIVDATSGDINIQTCTFEITETDDYDIVFQRLDGMAFIHKLNYECTGGYDTEPINPDNPPFLYPCLESSYVPVDPTTLCLDNNSGSVWQSGSNYNSEAIGGDPRVNFTPGVYQITVFNTASYATSNSDLSIYISHDEEITVANSYSLTPAGLRIQKTIDDPGMGQSTIEKTYKYTTSISGNTSSGKLIFNPKLFTISSVTIKDQVIGVWVPRVIVNRVAQASGGSQPHVVYSKVYEIEQNNGYTAHSFNTGVDGIVARPGPPYSNGFESNFAVGKESAAKTYSQTDTLLTSDIKSYNNNFIFSQRGLGLTNDSKRTYKFAAFEEIGNIFRLTYVDTWISPQGIEIPTECGSSAPNIHCPLMDAKYGSLEPLNMLASGSAGYVSKNELYSSYSNGTTNKVIDYIYTSNNLLKETKTTDSDGNSYKTINYYPGDLASDTVYEDMFNDHRLNTVVKKESYFNEVKTGTQQTIYKKWGMNTYLPELLQSAKDDLALEDRLQFHSYYTNGNVKEVSLKNGAKTVYIWGYDDRYPVAKIENATYVEIEALSPSCVLNFNLGSSGLSSVQENCLRDNLPNALVTTYTYIPMVGVSSITDPAKNTIYYQYDDFNRLSHVMNKDGEVISKNEYNYNNQN